MRCLICYEKFSPPPLDPGDRVQIDSQKSLFEVFRKFTGLQNRFENFYNWEEQNFPFCRYCKLMLGQLHQVNEQMVFLTKISSQLQAQIGAMIIETKDAEVAGDQDSDSEWFGDNDVDSATSKLKNFRKEIRKYYQASVNLSGSVQCIQQKSKNMTQAKMLSQSSPAEVRRSRRANQSRVKFELISPSRSPDPGESGDDDFTYPGMDDDSFIDERDPFESVAPHADIKILPDDVNYKVSISGESNSAISQRKRTKTYEMIKKMGENKFLFDDKVSFEVVDGVYKCGGEECDFTTTDRKELLTFHIPALHIGGYVERQPVTKQVEENKFVYHDRFTFEFSEDKFKCGTCDFTSSRKDSVQQHIKTRHVLGKERRVRAFPLVETEPGKFLYAERFVFEEHEGTLACKVGKCAAIKQRKEKMLLHIRSVHMEPATVHSCDRCGKSFREKRKLVQHLTIHSSERPHVCDICNQSFKLEIVLKKHKMFVHVGEEAKKHVCEICGKKWWNQFTLKEHIRSTHTKEKPFKCDVCLKAFARNAALKLHMELHKGERSFVCHLCGRAFASQAHLNKHFRVHSKPKSKKSKKVENEDNTEHQDNENDTSSKAANSDFVAHFLEV